MLQTQRWRLVENDGSTRDDDLTTTMTTRSGEWRADMTLVRSHAFYIVPEDGELELQIGTTEGFWGLMRLSNSVMPLGQTRNVGVGVGPT